MGSASGSACSTWPSTTPSVRSWSSSTTRQRSSGYPLRTDLDRALIDAGNLRIRSQNSTLNVRAPIRVTMAAYIAEQYDLFILTVLPARRLELIAIYRNALINAMAKLAVSGALAASSVEHPHLAAVQQLESGELEDVA